MSAERCSQTELPNADDCLLKTPNSCSAAAPPSAKKAATAAADRTQQGKQDEGGGGQKQVIIKSKTCEKQTNRQARPSLRFVIFSGFYERPHGVYLIGFDTISFDLHPHTLHPCDRVVAHAKEIALLII